VLDLALLCAATVLLIPLERWGLGGAVWLAGVFSLWRRPPPVRLRLGLLFAVVAWLAVAPIHTDRSTPHFLSLGMFFALAVLVPAWVLRRHDPTVQEWRLLPRRVQPLDLIYTALSVPLAWLILRGYFFVFSPEVPANWPMPAVFTEEARWRLIAGINAVGIWDELFFVNTVYAVMRSLYPAGVANLAQAVVYTAVLNDMAFTGVGPVVVYIFALTQGAMYERSRCLLYVLIVHLIVDAFLVAAILQYHYPGLALRWF